MSAPINEDWDKSDPLPPWGYVWAGLTTSVIAGALVALSTGDGMSGALSTLFLLGAAVLGLVGSVMLPIGLIAVAITVARRHVD